MPTISNPGSVMERDSGPGAAASGPRVMLMVALALGAGMGVAWSWDQSHYERLTGTLQSRMGTVAAPREAVIVDLLVQPGEHVKLGQPMVVLKDSQLELQLTQKKSEIEALQAELLEANARLEIELELRQKEVQQEIFETKLKLAEALKAQYSSQLENQAWTQVVRELQVSPVSHMPRISGDRTADKRPPEERVAELMLRKEKAMNAEQVSGALVELCQERMKQLERVLQDLPEKIRKSTGVVRIQSLLARAHHELAVIEQQQQNLTLKATATGTVGLFHKRPGEHVVAYEDLVQILDEHRPYVQLQIPSRQIASYVPGSVVTLVFPGGQKGQGKIEQIPPQTTCPLRTNGASGEPVVTAMISPSGGLWPTLPFGSAVEARRRR